MPPTPSKTNFKSYEAQARLLRAIVAAHPEVKWNYKGIVKFYGSDMTEHALNHRFRAIRAHCDVIKEAEAKGVDCLKIPADLPKDRKDIAKFFGESTGDGIQFQFRQIKKDADSLKQTARNGGNPATALNLSGGGTSSAFSTPRKFGTPSKPRASGGGRSTAKKTNSIKPPPMSEEDDDEENENVDYNALEDTPSKSRVRDRVLDGRVSKNANNGARSNTPSRAATIAAAASIAQAAAVDLTTSDSEVNTPDNEPVATHAKPAAVEKHNSSLAKPESQPVIQPDVSVYTAPSSFSQDVGDMFSNSVADESLNLSFDNSFGHGSYYDNNGYMENHGEI